MLPSDEDLFSRAQQRLGRPLCGRYRLSHLLAIGGMAAVYSGVHRNGHAVAVKILHDRLASDPQIERLFRREAQLANLIGHPGVVPVVDDDITEDGCVFLVMPLLRGETVRARAERSEGRRLPLAEVVVIAQAVLAALAAAHEKKIVHRDIKPENIFLTTSGEVKVLDFGIGRFFETNDAATATRSGRALGTPAFMAPEQALGRLRSVDGRTDLWALGATMFSLLSGRYVHEGESGTETAVMAATRAPSTLAEVAPAVPAELAAVVDRALAFEKEERWETAAEMARRLQEATRAIFGEAIADLSSVAGVETTDSKASTSSRVDAGSAHVETAFRAETDPIDHWDPDAGPKTSRLIPTTEPTRTMTGTLRDRSGAATTSNRSRNGILLVLFTASALVASIIALRHWLHGDQDHANRAANAGTHLVTFGSRKTLAQFGMV